MKIRMLRVPRTSVEERELWDAAIERAGSVDWADVVGVKTQLLRREGVRGMVRA